MLSGVLLKIKGLLRKSKEFKQNPDLDWMCLTPILEERRRLEQELILENASQDSSTSKELIGE